MQMNYQKEYSAGSVNTECTVEHVLPDYLGQIKRVLRVKVRAVPSGKFIADRGVSFGGILACEMLYVDGEGVLSASAFDTDYEFSVPIPEGGVDFASADTVVSGVGVRLGGPRKVTLRVMLTSSVYTPGGAEVLQPDPMPGLQTKECIVPIRHRICSAEVEREYAEVALTLEEGRNVEIITSGGQVQLEEAKVTPDGIQLTGQMILGAIVRPEGETPFAIEKRIPLDELIPIEGMEERMQPTGGALLTSVSATVGEDGSGERTVSLGAIVELWAEAEGNRSVSLVEDAFLVGRSAQTTLSPFSYEESLCAMQTTVAAGASASAIEEGEGLYQVMGTDVSVSVSGVSVEEGKVQILGEAHYTVVGTVLSEEGVPVFAVRRLDAPWTFHKALPDLQQEGTRVHYRLGDAAAVAKMDEERLELSLTLPISLWVSRHATVQTVTALEPEGMAVKRPAGVITVYYPEAGESLWQIAKKYGVEVGALASANGLELAVGAGEDALPMVERLVIV